MQNSLHLTEKTEIIRLREIKKQFSLLHKPAWTKNLNTHFALTIMLQDSNTHSSNLNEKWSKNNGIDSILDLK